jgi:phage antirepressor YoqD-like protein
MNQLITINGVRGFIDNDGTAQLNLDDISRGLGFTQRKGKVEYIRWERVNSYLIDMGFPQLVGKEFIPENVFYRLSMKGETDNAVSFQIKVADEILPSIRKHGTYMTTDFIEKSLSDPETYIKFLTMYKEEKEQRLLVEMKLKEVAPKAAYYDTILKSKGTVTSSQIAKDYGLSAQDLNKILHESKIQYKQNDQWLLYSKHADKGYTQSHAFDFNHKDGTPDVKMTTRWTQRGRIMIHELLVSMGIKPNIEKDYDDAK